MNQLLMPMHVIVPQQTYQTIELPQLPVARLCYLRQFQPQYVWIDLLYVKNCTGVEALQWLSGAQASNVIERLKKWLARIEVAK